MKLLKLHLHSHRRLGLDMEGISKSHADFALQINEHLGVMEGIGTASKQLNESILKLSNFLDDLLKSNNSKSE